MNAWTQALVDIGISIAATSVWGAIGLVIYRQQRANRRTLAYFMLYAGLDRLRDALREVSQEAVQLSVSGANISSFGDARAVLASRASHISYEWLVTNLPFKSKTLVWMNELDFLLNNAREITIEMGTVVAAVGRGDNHSTYIHNLESIVEHSDELADAIDHDMTELPEGANTLSSP